MLEENVTTSSIVHATTLVSNAWPAPDRFDFTRPADWTRWRKRFDRYRTVSGLIKQPNGEQVNALLYCMGEQAEEIFDALKLTPTQQSQYDEVVTAFEGHFVGKRNIVYERAIFNKRVQQVEETVDEFITALHTLSKYCEFGTLREEFIRDRIVVGIRDGKLSERLQLQGDLTLEKAVLMTRQNEQVKKQLSQLQAEPVQITSEVNRVQASRNSSLPAANSPGVARPPCNKCGYLKHRNPNGTCPAVKGKCSNCGVTGHFAKRCPMPKSTATIAQVLEPVEMDAFLGAIHTSTDKFIGSVKSQQRWKVTVTICNASVSFKVDTGADVSCIPEDIFSTYFPEIRLRPATRVLYNADHQRLRVEGYFQERIGYRGASHLTEIYVVKDLDHPLLDGDTCEHLNIIRRADVSPVSSRPLSFDPRHCFPEVFRGLGCVSVPYKIRLREGAQPIALTTPRRVPIPMLPEIKKNLNEMLKLGVIESVEEPTDWCSGLVLVPKPDGTLRMCVDYVRLNQFVLREVHPMPSTENIFGRLGKARYFSKMDARSGFWQCQLDPTSQLLTTFITPFGRFKFTRLPFGISAGPEVFQKRMMQILEGLQGIQCNVDDILVYGETSEQHDECLKRVLQRLSKAGVTLNPGKCEFGLSRVKFLGHILDEQGVHVDEDRVSAIKRIAPPGDVSELRSFLGTVNYLGRFIPHLATMSHPLNEMLRASSSFLWGPSQQAAFETLKQALSTSPTLALFDPHRPTILAADASSYGVGAVLQQEQDDGTLRPIAYASKTFSNAQRNWAQIEKEGYAIVWACERFRDFIIGLHVTLLTDHKPLVPIFSSKPLDDLSPKLQRLRLRLMRYSYSISHVPGKDIGAADFLSRQPVSNKEGVDELDETIEAYVHAITANLPASDERLAQIAVAQGEDRICSQLIQFCQQGWPAHQAIHDDLRQFWQYRHDLNVANGLLLKGARIVIPSNFRADILQQIHAGHLGIVKCRARAGASVWWPGISIELDRLVRQCTSCIQFTSNHKEPLMPSVFPSRPWQRVAIDLFYLRQRWYLLVTDYYSRYPEIALLSSLREKEVITHLKSFFARHGTPEEIFSDNGTHFGPMLTSNFSSFAKEWGFIHKTSSPHFPQSNGFVEAAVKIIKRSLEKSDDPYKALQAYRTTPLANGYSPAELLMSRRLRTAVPTIPANLQPMLPDKVKLKEKEDQRIRSQKQHFDLRHGVRPLSVLTPGMKVWIIDLRKMGTVREKLAEPRSYLVETDYSKIRRNRFHLLPVNSENGSGEANIEIMEDEESVPTVQRTPDLEIGDQTQTSSVNTEEPITTGVSQNRYGRTIKPPVRLNL